MNYPEVKRSLPGYLTTGINPFGKRLTNTGKGPIIVAGYDGDSRKEKYRQRKEVLAASFLRRFFVKTTPELRQEMAAVFLR